MNYPFLSITPASAGAGFFGDPLQAVRQWFVLYSLSFLTANLYAWFHGLGIDFKKDLNEFSILALSLNSYTSRRFSRDTTKKESITMTVKSGLEMVMYTGKIGEIPGTRGAVTARMKSAFLSIGPFCSSDQPSRGPSGCTCIGLSGGTNPCSIAIPLSLSNIILCSRGLRYLCRQGLRTSLFHLSFIRVLLPTLRV